MKDYEFYEAVANWDFSHLNYEIETKTDWDFFKEIDKCCLSNTLILDLGTGGGEKALKNFINCGMVIATDNSQEMINTARNNLKKYPDKKIKFAVMDNLNMMFPKDLFDIITARHTPIDAKQVYDCLNERGVLIIEGVDKYDCWELKETFKKGQCYTDNIPKSKIDLDNIKEAGFKDVILTEIVTYEYYKTEKDLYGLLMKTPIINDFSTEKIDYNLFKNYIDNHTTEKGIELKRILYGIVAKK